MTCLLLANLIAGCDRSSQPPQPMTAEELPAAMEKAFSKATGETKELSTQILGAVSAKDYAKALEGLHKLAMVTGLSKDQSSVLSRALLCVNNLLQSAQAQGDQNAAQALKLQRINK